MAIAMDVMRALRAFVADATEDFAVANPDMPRTVFIGWPGRKQIKEGHDKKDGEKGRTLISIFAPEGMERDITKYQASPIPLTPCSRSGYLIDAGDLTDQTRHRQQIRIVENEEAIFSVALKTGIASFVADDTLGVCVGPLVADPAVSYVTVGGESVEGALDALVALFNDPTTGIVVDRPWLVAFRNGSDFVVRFLPGAGGSGISEYVSFILGGQVLLGFEVKRSQRIFWVNIWAPSQTIRDSYQSILDTAFATFRQPSGLLPGVYNRLALADGTTATIFYNNSYLSDEEQLENNWRCQIALQAEYPTMDIVKGTEVICTNVTLTRIPVDPCPSQEIAILEGTGRRNGDEEFVTAWTGQKVRRPVAEGLASLLATNQTGCKI